MLQESLINILRLVVEAKLSKEHAVYFFNNFININFQTI